jgi:hypothetical protein
MLTFEIVPPKELDPLMARLRDYGKIANKHNRKAMKGSVISIERGARKTAPVGVAGRLRNSMASEVREKKDVIIGRVGSTMKKEIYPIVMELGRKAGKAPPPGALDRWVRIVLGVSPKKVRSVSFLIGRRMKRKKMKGRRFLTKAYRKERPKIHKRFGKALKDITKELAHGK